MRRAQGRALHTHRPAARVSLDAPRRSATSPPFVADETVSRGSLSNGSLALRLCSFGLQERGVGAGYATAGNGLDDSGGGGSGAAYSASARLTRLAVVVPDAAGGSVRSEATGAVVGVLLRRCRFPQSVGPQA